MRAGTLRHLVTLQSPGGAKDSFGARITSWEDVAVAHASVEPIAGRDQFLASQQQASTTHIVRMRWSSEWADIDSTWRVKYGTRVFTIDGPPKNTDERGREFVLSCTEGERQE